jgi:dCTP deaminase
LTFWSGDKILEELTTNPDIVNPFDTDNIDCSSYRLTLGSQYFISPDNDVKLRDSVKKSLAAPDGDNMGGQVSIPPGQFAFLLTEELLDIPIKTMAFISMRAGFKMNGLINVSGFHVDPGFKGRLVFAVYNAGPATVSLARGEPLFLIWFADLDESATAKFTRQQKPPQLEIPNEFIRTVNHPIHALQTLSKKIDEIETEQKFFKRAFYVAAAFVSLVIAAAGFWLNTTRPMALPTVEQTQTTAKPTPPAPAKSGAAPAPKDVLAPPN